MSPIEGRGCHLGKALVNLLELLQHRLSIRLPLLINLLKAQQHRLLVRFHRFR